MAFGNLRSKLSEYVPPVFILWVALLPYVASIDRSGRGEYYWFFTGSTLWAVLLLLKVIRIRWEATDIWHWAWLTALTLTSLVGIHPLDSLTGGSIRHQGVVFFVSLWVTGNVIRSLRDNQQRMLVTAIAISILLQLVVVLVQVFAGKYLPFPSRVFDRIVGTFGEPNVLAGFLAIGSWFVYQALLWHKVHWLIRLLVRPLLLVGVLVTGSRSGLLAFLIVTIGWLIVRHLHDRWTKTVVRTVVFSVILAVVVTTGLWITRTRPDSPYEGREVIWSLAATAIAREPLLGYGAESGEKVFESSYKHAGINLHGLIIDRAHNLWLDVAIWSGLPGLILFVGWIVSVSMANRENRQWLNLVGLASWLTFASLQPMTMTQWVMGFAILHCSILNQVLFLRKRSEYVR